MKKKPKIETNEKGKTSGIIFAILIGILIVLCILLAITKKEVVSKPKCYGTLGGEYTVKFESNGGNAISNISVCVACSPDSYTSLALPTKEGYKFTGWYYDRKLSSPVKGESTADIDPEINFVDGCIVGYKDITLYAGWE